MRHRFYERFFKLPLALSLCLAMAALAQSQTWTSLGPNNVGGKTRQLVTHPTNPQILYAGSVGGGVWKTVNGGDDWQPLTDGLTNLVIGALALDPTNPQILYAGTGEGFYNLDSVRGDGIFKSIDGGNTWTQLAATASNSDFHYVMQIVVSPRNSQRLYAATRTGIWRSNDGGTSWGRVNGALAANGCSDLQIQLKRTVGFIFASCGLIGPATIYRALDSTSSSFTPVFTTQDMGRTSLAIAPSDEGIIYALASSDLVGSSRFGLLGVYRSSQNGAAGTWTAQLVNSRSSSPSLNDLLLSNSYASLCSGSPATRGNSGWFANSIAVDPLNPERVWAGGINLFRSDDGGRNWGLAGSYANDGVTPTSTGSNHFAIRFSTGYNGGSDSTLYVANNNGVIRTTNSTANVLLNTASACSPNTIAVTWTALNNNYVTSQFYGGAVYPGGNRFIGGLGSGGYWRGSVVSKSWNQLPVDRLLIGGNVAIAKDGRNLFVASTSSSFLRSANDGESFAEFNGGISGLGRDFLIFQPLALSDSTTQTLWTGSSRLWRSSPLGTNWTAAGAASSDSVSAIAIFPSNDNIVLFGTNRGRIGFNFSAMVASGNTFWRSNQPRSSQVTSLAFDPSTSGHAYATYATFSGISLYRSLDSGQSWSPLNGISPNALPAVPANAVVVHPTNSNQIFVGTDQGLYRTTDGGTNWFRDSAGLPNARIEKLEFARESGQLYLFAFTRGRGAWRLQF